MNTRKSTKLGHSIPDDDVQKIMKGKYQRKRESTIMKIEPDLNTINEDTNDLCERAEISKDSESSEKESNWSVFSKCIEEECKYLDQKVSDHVSSSQYAESSNSDVDFSDGIEEDDVESDNPNTSITNSSISNAKTRLSKGKWSDEEDKLLLKLIDNKRHPTWKRIAMEFPTRNAKQCRDRWLYHLSPDVNKEEFSELEDGKLIQYHKMFGNRWHDICKLIGNGRHVNMIRSRILLLLRRQRKLALKAARKRPPRSECIQNIITLNNLHSLHNSVRSIQSDDASTKSAGTQSLGTVSRRYPIPHSDKFGSDSVTQTEHVGGPKCNTFHSFHPTIPVVPHLLQAPGAPYPAYYYPPPYSTPYYPSHQYAYVPTSYLHPYYIPNQLHQPSSETSRVVDSVVSDDKLSEISIHDLYKRREIIDTYIMQRQGQRHMGLNSNEGSASSLKSCVSSSIHNLSQSLQHTTSPDLTQSIASQ